jgi:hypothetical protein
MHMKKYFLFALLAMYLVGCDSPAPYPSGGDSDDNGGGGSNNKSYVVTGEAKDVTHKSVTLYGEVNVEIADYETIEWGMMYSTDMDELEDRNGVMVACDDALIENAYRVELSDLVSETKYYYCAYVNLNNKQYRFGETKEFTTLAAPSVNEITILTGSAEDVTYNSVVLYGELEADMSNYSSVQYGISYSTDRNDLQSANSTLVYCSESLQENSYSVALSGLEAETKYYYCAFVYVNNQDFKYGTVKNFTTLEAPKIDVIGVFSVSADKQVIFSKGNLQYTQSTDTWSFAANQYDYIGTDNVTGGTVSSDPTDGDSKEGTALADKVDLFGWSTSANNFGVSTSTDYDDYYGSFVDWGTNKIGNDAPNTWRTLSYDEWYYLRYTRTNADALCGVAQVNGVNGLILLPDNWTCPSGITFKSGFYSYSSAYYYADYQIFTAAEWPKLEAAGAVFLPASGYRDGSDVVRVQYYGGYWSATELGGCCAYCLGFRSGVADMGYSSRYIGYPVRLVKDL